MDTLQPPAHADQDLASESCEEVLRRLRVDPHAGLSADEVRARRASEGFNEVAEAGTHPIAAFLARFWSPSAWMLEIIVALSVLLGKLSDAAVVTALLGVNATVGFLQERRAAGVVAALRRQLHVAARVLRDGKWQVVPARELVPGDIVRVRSGDIVPADLKLLSGALEADMSALTGESRSVQRASPDVLASGSILRGGEGEAVVALTGGRTLFGRTTELVQRARPKLHVEAVVARVVRWLFAIVGTLLAAVIALSVARGAPLLPMASLMLVLLMSAVPVALPVMFTVSMAVGSRELARRGVLVTRLGASEDAATMDVLCVDKTGTITENRLVVSGVFPEEGVTEAQVLQAGACASEEANQDPIDLAFLAATRSGAGDMPPRLSFAPFDAQTRRTEAVVLRDGRRVRTMKGALRTVAALCGRDDAQTARLEERAQASVLKGHRVLAVAEGPVDGPPALLGLVALHDPPRADARELIARLRGIGIAVKMLTGDALDVARDVGARVGLPNVRRAADAAATPDADGFAEVYPEDKYAVVSRLQAAGHVVGMTGDGVNDAPALRQAEVGIAVRGATDVAKGAASVVLTDAGLINILALVEQGRAIYQRVLTWIVNKISRTILKAGFVATTFVLTGKFAVSAFAMLLLVFMTDFAKIAIATDRVRPSPRPETWRIGGYVTLAAVLGVAMVLEALAFFAVGWLRLGLADDDRAMYSFSFLLLLYFAAFSVLSVRERRWFWSSVPSPVLAGALALDLLAGTALTYVGLPDLAPLPAFQVLSILGYAAAACLGLNDAIKVALLSRQPAGA